MTPTTAEPADGRGDVAGHDVLTDLFEAVLFDNDSTLTDSRVAIEQSWTAWATHFGIARDRLTGTHGVPARQTISRLAPELSIDEAASVFDQIELGLLDDVNALPGAREALAAVGERAAIVTSAGRVLLGRRLEAARLHPPAVVVTADDVRDAKPNPEPYLEAARRLGVDPRRCVVVEDAVPGVQSARAAGAATIALLTTATSDELAAADLVIPDLSAVRFTQVPGGVRVALR